MTEVKRFNISTFFVFFHLSLNFNFFFLSYCSTSSLPPCLPVSQAAQPAGASFVVCHCCAASVPSGEVVFTAEMMLCPKAAP